jgi:hypothetical protein
MKKLKHFLNHAPAKFPLIPFKSTISIALAHRPLPIAACPLPIAPSPHPPTGSIK